MKKIRTMLHEKRAPLIVAGLILTFIVIFELPKIVIVIGSGEVGVKYSLFFGGTIIDHVYAEGVTFIFPWDRMYIYDTRIQESKVILSALTKDALEIEIDLSIRCHPEVAMIGILHQAIGPDYQSKVAIPEVESAIRTSVGKHTLEELYSGEPGNTEPGDTTTEKPGLTATGDETRKGSEADIADETLQSAIDAAVDRASKKYVLIDNVVITRIKIPEYVQAAIQRKLEQKQILESQGYRVEQSKEEVEINDRLSKSLTPEILRLRGIEATEKLATSPNSKVVIMGNGPGGLPVIINPQQ